MVFQTLLPEESPFRTVAWTTEETEDTGGNRGCNGGGAGELTDTWNAIWMKISNSDCVYDLFGGCNEDFNIIF
jgi:hypothetical protein